MPCKRHLALQRDIKAAVEDLELGLNIEKIVIKYKKYD